MNLIRKRERVTRDSVVTHFDRPTRSLVNEGVHAHNITSAKENMRIRGSPSVAYFALEKRKQFA